MAVLYLLLISLISVSLALAQPFNKQGWQTGTVASDTLSVTCRKLLLPFDLGRLLVESNPTSVRGEMDSSLSSSHPMKVDLQPQTGTSDTISAITGTIEDGCEIDLSVADVGDSITIPHTAGQFEFDGGVGITITSPLQVFSFVRKGGRFVLKSGGGGSGSGGGNVVLSDGQRVDLRSVNSANQNEGILFNPNVTNCASAITDGQLCIDVDDLTMWLGNGSGIDPLGGPGAGGITTADAAFDSNPVVDGRIGEVNAAKFQGDPNEGACIKIFEDASSMVAKGYTDCGGVSEAEAAPTNKTTFLVPISKFDVDDTHCVRAFNVTLQDSQSPVVVTCADNDAATIKVFVLMRDSWDGVNLQIFGAIHSGEATPAGDIELDWVGRCVESGGENDEDDNYPAEVANGTMLFDLDAATPAQHDFYSAATTGNIPLSNCTGTGKRLLWLRAQLDAGNTTADNLTQQHYLEFTVEYGLRSFTD